MPSTGAAALRAESEVSPFRTFILIATQKVLASAQPEARQEMTARTACAVMALRALEPRVGFVQFDLRSPICQLWSRATFTGPKRDTSRASDDPAVTPPALKAEPAKARLMSGSIPGRKPAKRGQP